MIIKDLGRLEKMSQYYATIEWLRAENELFTDAKYSRGHRWLFDGGVSVPASSSPHIIPTPYSVAANVDPEEAFVAALSSCHMLWFLHLAAEKSFIVDSYTDSAVGVMAKNSEGKLAITEVALRPNAEFSGDSLPSAEQVNELHHAAHESCFIANSVRTNVTVEAVV